MSNVKGHDIAENVCVVCCRKVIIYAIGECDHPVCYECATRMRVLCRQNECPICRRELPKVYYTKLRQQYAEVTSVTYALFDRKFCLYFDDADVQHAHYRLLEHRCRICKNKPTFLTFSGLKDHVRKEHELHFCDLCVEHLKIFTHERKCYNRSELARHRRIGDPDDTSHRGHPLCEFCDERYLDSDELFRHLRREHFYCHFCDADGHTSAYYSDYDYLRKHFRAEHFLCEEDDCRNEKFTTAFRTEIDLKAHRAQEHNKGLTKAQVKQARTLELEFTIAPRGAASTNDHGNGISNSGYDDEDLHPKRGRRAGHGTYRGRPNSHHYYSRTEDPPTAVDSTATVAPAPSIDMNSSADFPTLGTESTAAATAETTASITDPKLDTRGSNRVDTLANKLAKLNRFTVSTGGSNRGLDENEFPALGGHGKSSASSGREPNSKSMGLSSKSWGSSSISSSAAPASSSGSATLSLTSTSQTPTNNTGTKKTLTLKLNSQEEFPGLVSSSKRRLPPNVSIQLTSKPSVDDAAMPPKENGTWAGEPKASLAQPVVTRLASTQNITFLNPTVAQSTIGSSATTADRNTLSSDRHNEYKEAFSKTDDGWYVLKKGKGVTEKQDSVGFSRNDDFPALQTKESGTKFVRESSARVPVTSSWVTDRNGREDRTTEVSVAKSQQAKTNKKQKSKVENGNSEVERSAVPSGKPSSKTETTDTAGGKKKKRKSASSRDHKGDAADEEKNSSSVAELKLEVATETEEKHIPEVEATSNGTMTMDDFPSLVSSSEVVKSVVMPPGFSSLASNTNRPPPGFGAPVPSSNPPPGFAAAAGKAATSPASGVSMITFTNSIGQNFTLPSPASGTSYVEPRDFQKRNQGLVRILQEALQHKDESVSTFKTISAWFRQGGISAAEYYQRCLELIGPDKFATIFQELLVLLPDISKQHELLAAYNAREKHCSGKFLACASCRQIVTADDRQDHENLHLLDANFPSLLGANVGPAQQLCGTWLNRK